MSYVDYKRIAEEAEAKRLAGISHKAVMEDLRTILSTPHGRRYMWRLMGLSGLFQAVFNTNGSLMNLQEGKRQMGLFLLKEINDANPEAYVLMMKENKETE